MEELASDEITIAYDDGSQSYYCIWRPLTCVGLGKTEAEALDDLRAAAHLGVETMVSLKNEEDSKELLFKQEDVMDRRSQDETTSDADNARKYAERHKK